MKESNPNSTTANHLLGNSDFHIQSSMVCFAPSARVVKLVDTGDLKSPGR